MPNVLFVHNGAPGRFSFLARALGARGWKGCLLNGPQGTDLPGMPTMKWSGPIETGATGVPRQTAESMRRGEHAAVAAEQLKTRGFVPDLIIGHPAWGEMLYLKQVFPEARQIQLAEFYFRTSGTDFNFDPEFPVTNIQTGFRQHSANAPQVLSYCDADRLVCPTHFQAASYPAIFRPIMEIIHEGIDTDVARPRDPIRLTLADGTVLDRSTPVVAFINRRFEPMRGFHIFMRSLPKLLREVPDAQAVLVGIDGTDSYGPAHKSGSWKKALLEEIAPTADLSRVHFVGALEYNAMCALLASSTAHVHFSYPMVLSWSLLDSMACGSLVVGSRTASIEEVIEHGRNGLLVDFFDVEGLSETLIDVCRRPADYAHLRKAARETVMARYDRTTVCEPAWLRLIDEVMAAR